MCWDLASVWAALYTGGFHPALALGSNRPVHAAQSSGSGRVRRTRSVSARHAQQVRALVGHARPGCPSSIRIRKRRRAVNPNRSGHVLRPRWPPAWQADRHSGCSQEWRGSSGGGYLPSGPPTESDLFVVGVVAAIGFTVSLFFATAAFPAGAALAETKMGALFSFVAAPIAVVLADLACACELATSRVRKGCTSRPDEHRRRLTLADGEDNPGHLTSRLTVRAPSSTAVEPRGSLPCTWWWWRSARSWRGDDPGASRFSTLTLQVRPMSMNTEVRKKFELGVYVRQHAAHDRRGGRFHGTSDPERILEAVRVEEHWPRLLRVWRTPQPLHADALPDHNRRRPLIGRGVINTHP